MTDEELIVAVINDPDGKYGRLYDHRSCSGYASEHPRAIPFNH
jgi:hypothetical protein